MSFVANAPAPVNWGNPIKNIWFFPDIEPTKAAESLRLDGTVTPGRLRAALISAITHVNNELRGWCQIQIAGGAEKLADIPADQIDDESCKLIHYRWAIYYTASAELCEGYANFDTTAAGQKKVEDQHTRADELRREAHKAIAALLDRPSTIVELI